MRCPNRSLLLFVAVVLAMGIAITPAHAAPRGNPIPLAEEYRVPVRGAAPSAGCDTVQYDDGTAAFIWLSPDTFGDTMQFVRFSPTFTCTLKTVQFWVADAANGMVGTPGTTVDIYSEAGGFPDTLISSIDVPFGALTFFPSGPNVVDFSGQGLTFDKDFCVVLRRFGTDADTMVLLSDDGTSGTMRSGEFWAGPPAGWELILDGWGVDVNFFVRAELCCGDPPACTPGAQPDWPTYGGSFQRTMRSGASISNECQLTLDWIAQGDLVNLGANVSAFTNVVVKDPLAFLTYNNFLTCYDARTGAELWQTGPRDSFPVWGQDMRCNVTVDDSLVYVGGGAFNSFNCIRVVDGSLVWSYNSTSPPPIPRGPTRFAPAVLIDSIVYWGTEFFGSNNGDLFALNKYTGTLFSGWATNPAPLSEGGIMNGLASDGDSLLFVGTVSGSSILTNGRLYAFRAADGTPKWELEDPSAIFLDPTLDEEGFSGFLSYESGILYYQSNIRDDASGFDHFPYDGAVGAIDVNLEDGSGAGILWGSPQPIGRVLYGGPVLGEGIVYVGTDGIFVGAENPKGVIALNKSNGARLWHNPLDGAGVPMPLTVTCEATGNPYVFAGTRAGVWYLLDGFTGDVLWTRTFTGLVHGTVVLDSQVLRSTRSSRLGNGNGQLASFQVTGTDRPRMEVLQTTVFQANALPGSGNTTTDTIYNALSNIGCADLTISSFGVDTVSLAAVVMATDPALAARAHAVADQMASSYLDFVMGFPTGPSMLHWKRGLLRQGLDAESEIWTPYVSDWTRQRLAEAAVDQVIAVENTTPATVGGGAMIDIALRIDETGQTPRTTVRNYIVLNQNDPDFFPEDTSYSTLGSPVIPVDAIFGFAQEQDTIRAVDAYSMITNHGSMGNGDDSIFWVEGDNSASMFDGSFLITGFVNGDSVRTAWDVYDWQEFQPNDFLRITRDTALGTFTGLDTVTGSIAQSVYIDSIGFPDSAQTYAFGVEVHEMHVGFNLASQGLASFKLVQTRIINRNATPIDSVIYLGAFMDWDIESGNNDVLTTQVGIGNVYMYDPTSLQSAYGVIKLPAPGVPFAELDGTLDTATGFYSVYGVYNPDEVYPSGAFQPLVDHIYDYVSTPGVNSRGGLIRDDDMSLAVCFDTLHLAANDTVYVRYALWGWDQNGSLSNAGRDAVMGANLTAGFRRGDVNADGNYDFLDLTWLYRWVTSGGTTASPIPRPENGDVNNDGSVDQADVDYLEAFLYGNGPAPIGKWWW